MKLLFIVMFFGFHTLTVCQTKTINNKINEVNILNSKNGKFNINKVDNLNIAEKPKIPDAENVTYLLDTLKHSFTAKPIEGQWTAPYFAYPDIDSLTNGRMQPSLMTTIDRMEWTRPNGRSLLLVVIRSTGRGPATNSFGYTFYYEHIPRFIIYGDFSDPSKQFMYKIDQIIHY